MKKLFILIVMVFFCFANAVSAQNGLEIDTKIEALHQSIVFGPVWGKWTIWIVTLIMAFLFTKFYHKLRGKEYKDIRGWIVLLASLVFVFGFIATIGGGWKGACIIFCYGFIFVFYATHISNKMYIRIAGAICVISSNIISICLVWLINRGTNYDDWLPLSVGIPLFILGILFVYLQEKRKLQHT
jgi:hypothetical protein